MTMAQVLLEALLGLAALVAQQEPHDFHLIFIHFPSIFHSFQGISLHS